MNKLINAGLILSFSICYMEWGGNNASTIWQAEYEIFSKSKDLFSVLTHPVILSGLSGQLLLLYCVIAAPPVKKINIAGILLLGLVVLLILLAGILSMNAYMTGSTLPFLFLATLFFIRLKKGLYP